MASEQAAPAAKSPAHGLVAGLIAKARAAQREFEKCSQAEVDEAVVAATLGFLGVLTEEATIGQVLGGSVLGVAMILITLSFRETRRNSAESHAELLECKADRKDLRQRIDALEARLDATTGEAQ